MNTLWRGIITSRTILYAISSAPSRTVVSSSFSNALVGLRFRFMDIVDNSGTSPSSHFARVVQSDVGIRDRPSAGAARAPSWKPIDDLLAMHIDVRLSWDLLHPVTCVPPRVQLSTREVG